MLRELTDSPILIRVQTWAPGAAVPPALEAALALEWPTTVGTVVTRRTAELTAGRKHPVAAIACVSPTESLIIGANSDAADPFPPLETILAGTPFRATTVTHALARIELDGPAARLLLAKGCSLDLHPSRFSPDRCARTRLAGMPVILWCTQESTFQCIVTSSYREYLVTWLADAGLEMEMFVS